MSESGPARVAVKCERHGLHYNPALHVGCALCRREAAPPAAPGLREETARLRKAWLVAFGLIVVMALCLTFVEGSILRTLVPFVPAEAAFDTSVD